MISDQHHCSLRALGRGNSISLCGFLTSWTTIRPARNTPGWFHGYTFGAHDGNSGGNTSAGPGGGNGPNDSFISYVTGRRSLTTYLAGLSNASRRISSSLDRNFMAVITCGYRI